MDLQKSYKEDIRLFKKPSALVAFLVFLAGLIAFPFLMLSVSGGSYYVNAVNLIAIYGIVAVGLNILVGYTGQISLGHAGFFAMSSIANSPLGVRSPLPMPTLYSLM